MKKIIYLLVLVGVLAACKPEAEVLDISGEWRLTDMTLTKSVQLGDQTIEIYIAFKQDNTFDLWQFLGAGRYEKFTGTWTLAEDILTGKYSDGSQWGNVYRVSLKNDTLTLEATENSSDVYTYTRTTIPSGGPSTL